MRHLWKHTRHWWYHKRWGSPHWRDDKVAKMLGYAHRGCPKCGYGATDGLVR
jgi:hypothetical protein